MRTGRSSPAVSEVTKDKEEEEVNLEVSKSCYAQCGIVDCGLMEVKYLRNVILQFLEHKEMRPNLVRVLSVILHFTPQELRRLHSKISA